MRIRDQKLINIDMLLGVFYHNGDSGFKRSRLYPVHGTTDITFVQRNEEELKIVEKCDPNGK